jgi:hypothetical protein
LKIDNNSDCFVPKGASSSKTIFCFNENDDSSDESFVEPFGAGHSDADPDFVAEPKHSSSSSIHSDFEEVIYEIRNDTDKTKRRRSVQHPSQIEKTFSRKRKNNKRDEWQKNKAKELRNKGMCYESMQVKKK